MTFSTVPGNTVLRMTTTRNLWSVRSSSPIWATTLSTCPRPKLPFSLLGVPTQTREISPSLSTLELARNRPAATWLRINWSRPGSMTAASRRQSTNNQDERRLAPFLRVGLSSRVSATKYQSSLRGAEERVWNPAVACKEAQHSPCRLRPRSDVRNGESVLRRTGGCRVSLISDFRLLTSAPCAPIPKMERWYDVPLARVRTGRCEMSTHHNEYPTREANPAHAA